MINRFFRYLFSLRDRQRIIINLSKGAISSQSRNIDQTQPSSWEFSGFSQNGEDGIIDYLISRLKKSNRYFIEIGSADGIDNNTAWLAICKKFNGLMIEGNPQLVTRAINMVKHFSLGLRIHNLFVTKDSADNILSIANNLEPDLFSLDIDGIDYYVAKSLFKGGLRPKIVVVEYNSVFGPDLSLTVEYSDSFNYLKEHNSQLYYGVSISAWMTFFDSYGYKFISTDLNGVNAFFVNPGYFDKDFLSGIIPVPFRENRLQSLKFNSDYVEQFSRIRNKDFFNVT